MLVQKQDFDEQIDFLEDKDGRAFLYKKRTPRQFFEKTLITFATHWKKQTSSLKNIRILAKFEKNTTVCDFFLTFFVEYRNILKARQR